MKVLLTSHLFPNEVDPVSGVFVKEEAQFLTKRCELKIVAPIPWFPPLRGFGRWSRLSKIPYRQQVDGLDVFHPRYLLFPRRILFCTAWFFYLLALLQVGRKLEFDLVHAHVAYPDGLAAVLFSKITRRPVIITTHGGDVKTYPRERKIWKLLTVLALLKADKIVAVSNDLKKAIRELGVDVEKVEVIPNGVDITLFHPIAKSTAVAEKRIRNLARIIYVGRLEQQKGVEVLVRAMSMLVATRGDLELTVVGANRAERGEAEVLTLTRQLGLEEKIRFIDAVPLYEVPLWIATADVLVLPSFSEGFGLSLVEALACGRPVVSTTCGGPEDIVTEKVGILVPPGDAKALARAIAYVLDHPEKYNPMKISSYAHQRFSLEKISSQIFDLYLSLGKVAC